MTKTAATATEIANYKLVEEKIANYTDEEFNDFLDMVMDAFMTCEKNHKKAYAKAYRLAKKWGTTVPALFDWYFTEEVC